MDYPAYIMVTCQHNNLKLSLMFAAPNLTGYWDIERDIVHVHISCLWQSSIDLFFAPEFVHNDLCVWSASLTAAHWFRMVIKLTGITCAFNGLNAQIQAIRISFSDRP